MPSKKRKLVHNVSFKFKQLKLYHQDDNESYSGDDNISDPESSCDTIISQVNRSNQIPCPIMQQLFLISSHLNNDLRMKLCQSYAENGIMQKKLWTEMLQLNEKLKSSLEEYVSFCTIDCGSVNYLNNSFPLFITFYLLHGLHCITEKPQFYHNFHSVLQCESACLLYGNPSLEFSGDLFRGDLLSKEDYETVKYSLSSVGSNCGNLPSSLFMASKSRDRAILSLPMNSDSKIPILYHMHVTKMHDLYARLVKTYCQLFSEDELFLPMHGALDLSQIDKSPDVLVLKSFSIVIDCYSCSINGSEIDVIESVLLPSIVAYDSSGASNGTSNQNLSTLFADCVLASLYQSTLPYFQNLGNISKAIECHSFENFFKNRIKLYLH